MIRFVNALWWVCVPLAALSLLTDIIWSDGQAPAWIALMWLGVAVMHRLDRGRA